MMELGQKQEIYLCQSDGTAKVQDDDIIRSKTVGKVLTKIETLETSNADLYHKS